MTMLFGIASSAAFTRLYFVEQRDISTSSLLIGCLVDEEPLIRPLCERQRLLGEVGHEPHILSALRA